MRHRAASVLPGHERPGVAQPDLPQALSARWRSGHSAGQGHGAGSSCCSQGGEPCCCEAGGITGAAPAAHRDAHADSGALAIVLGGWRCRDSAP